MVFLGIDQSYTSSGIVLLDEVGSLLESYTFKTPKDEDVYFRAWNISEHILNVVKTHNVSAIAIEGLAFGMRGDATRDLAGLQFLIISKVRYVVQKEIEIVTPRTLKKFATTDGKADKTKMIESLPDDVRSHMIAEGYKKTTGLADLADAYYLAQYIRDKVANKK